MRSSISERQILVREIDRGFEMGEDMGQPPRPVAVKIAESAVELAQGLATLRLGLGGGEIGDRLGLGQVELAVQKRAAGELARLGEPQPEAGQHLDNSGEHGAAAMQMKFGDILAGSAIRRREPQHQPVVERFAGRRVGEPASTGISRRRNFPGEHRHRPRGIGSGQPDHRDSGPSGCRRRCKDGVGIGLRLAKPVARI